MLQGHNRGEPGGPVSRDGRRPDVLRWLDTEPTLDELRRVFPHEWEDVQTRLSAAAEDGETALHALVAELSAPRVGTPDHRRRKDDLVADEVRRQMLLHAVQRAAFTAEAGVDRSEIAFDRLNGQILQRLFFRRGLERKPVSTLAYTLLWPLARQRRYVMPLVRPRGVYCFYSAALVRRLAKLIGSRETLEIAAGDGTLSRFLRQRGVDVVATDNHSWARSIDYPDDVVRQDAVAALRARRPQVVVCSWPPVGNAFEREVFRTPSVQTYIVIGSTRETGSGNWFDYRRQTGFTYVRDLSMGRLVLPRYQGNAVLIFQRRAAVTGS